MRNVLFALVICACTASFAANAAVPNDRNVLNDRTTHSSLIKSAKNKYICKWILKWINKKQVRVQSCVLAVRG
jgi:hypothetical protein